MATPSPTLPSGSLPDPTRNWIALGLNFASFFLFALHGSLFWYFKRYPKRHALKWKIDMISMYMLATIFTVAQFCLAMVPQGAAPGVVADPSLRGNQASDVMVANLSIGSFVYVFFSVEFAMWWRYMRRRKR